MGRTDSRTSQERKPAGCDHGLEEEGEEEGKVRLVLHSCGRWVQRR